MTNLDAVTNLRTNLDVTPELMTDIDTKLTANLN